MEEKAGAIPDFMIRELIAEEFIKDAADKNVMPASLNLSMSDEMYRVQDVFQLNKNEQVKDVLKHVGASRFEPGTPLEPGVHYLARLNESVSLPKHIYGYCNPRSSTGRNDVLVRVVADGLPRYDAVSPAGYAGNLWALIGPKSYAVRLRPGQTLTQLRLFSEDTRFNEVDLELAMKNDKLLWRKSGEPFTYDEIAISDNDGSIILTVDLSSDIVGWECLGSSHIFDFGEQGYSPYEFYRPLKLDGDRIHLKERGFYILYTSQFVRVPPHLACEMVAMDARSGEFRSHYAGFIDPGWGYGPDGTGKGRRLVLEVRPFENFMFRRGQPAAKIRFERMYDIPHQHYDQLPNSSYNHEEASPRLSSHFKME